MSIPKITKSKSTNHHYTERERQQALIDYDEVVVEEINHIYDLYDRYLQQVQHKSFKSDNYDFELHNQLSFDIEQVKRIVKHKGDVLRENYDLPVEGLDFDLLLENYQANKK